MLIASKTVGVEVAPGLRVRVVGGQPVPAHLREAYLRTVGGGVAAPAEEPAAVVEVPEPDVPAAQVNGERDDAEPSEAAEAVALEEAEAEPDGETDEPAQVNGEQGARDDLEQLKRPDLMRRAAQAGVPARGSNAELIAAIRAAEAK